jgi:hypothetical protein
VSSAATVGKKVALAVSAGTGVTAGGPVVTAGPAVTKGGRVMTTGGPVGETVSPHLVRSTLTFSGGGRLSPFLTRKVTEKTLKKTLLDGTFHT